MLRRGYFVGWLVIVAMALWILPRPASASDAAKSSKPSAKKSASSRKAVHRKSSTRRHTTRRSSNYRARLARLQLEPERIQEIQQALIREGYLAHEPTGKWDDATRAAMKSFQEKNGFPARGLPEAKSLMKLGLGPHPLPPDLDPAIVGQASISSPATESPDPNNR
jgi:peptidoglycan hydrolase-like protein with peptidoglycan-binding domain